ncbi:MAG TPA: cupredoxin domain-containing protein [Candidatus Saccharimonadales bacterium]|nr:cupredoxin domain-containing protein [Candidatus Saccharimonadales bacterium]
MGTRSDSSLLVWLVMGILAIVALCSMFFVINHRSTVSGLSNTGEIVIGADGFSPATLRIKKGSVVTWNNRGLDQHELAADQSELGLGNGQLLEIGDSYTYRFTNAGTYTYYDADNPNAFKGTVIVE